MHIHVTHGFLVRRRQVRDAALPGCDVVAGIGRVRLVALTPLVHGNDGEGGVSLADGGAALGSLARVAPPRRERDRGDEQQQQQQGQDQVQRVDSAHEVLKFSGFGAALTLVLLPETPLRPIKRQE